MPTRLRPRHPTVRRASRRVLLSAEDSFLALWRAAAGPPLEREARFDGTRRWRFDFAERGSQVAVEIEGGIWIQGRHLRARGYEADCEKYSVAALQGWAVIRLTPRMVRQEGADWVTRILAVVSARRQGRAV